MESIMEGIKYGRKSSGIKKELNEVIVKWVASIDDENLRKLVYDNVIVTGGSICSMLMGDSVNDYDIYFKTKAAAIKVAQYYMSKHFNINCIVKYGDDFSFDEDDAIDNERIAMFNFVREYKCANIRGEIEERVECFIASTGVSDNTEVSSTDENGAYRVSYISSNAITLTDNIQIIIRFFGTPDQIHNNYDFAHAKCYFDYAEQHLHLDPHAMQCMLSRTLIYEGSLYPIASVFRMKKFIERGWRISAGQQLKIMWQISELNLNDMRVLKEQLTGVDMLYLHCLFDAISKSGKDVDSQYVSKIIDRIFEE